MQLTVAPQAAADGGPSAYLDAAQDRLHAQVEAALAPLHAGPARSPRSERVRRALRDLDLAWPDAIRGEQFGCPCHSSYTIGGWELFIADDGTPRCAGGCPPEKVLEALGIRARGDGGDGGDGRSRPRLRTRTGHGCRREGLLGGRVL